MKSIQKHINFISRCLVILSGIVLYSILPFGEHDLPHFVRYNVDYEFVENSEETESDQSSGILELTFKETPEEKESSKSMNSHLAIVKQGITATKISFIKLSLDKVLFFKKTRHLSVYYNLCHINKAVNHLSLSFLPYSNCIAINAP